MARRPARQSGRIFAWSALALLACAAAVSYSPNSRQGPLSQAVAGAERAAAIRVAAAGSLPSRRAIVSGAAVPLPAGASQVVLGGGATRVRVPSVGIDAEVRSVGYLLVGGQLQYDTPRFEAGHYAGTADPGMAGNMVIGGHVTNRGAAAVFNRLPAVKIGEVVEVFRGDEIFRYSIIELRVVAPDATAVMARSHDATITLITCSPEQDHRDRVVVIGKLL